MNRVLSVVSVSAGTRARTHPTGVYFPHVYTLVKTDTTDTTNYINNIERGCVQGGGGSVGGPARRASCDPVDGATRALALPGRMRSVLAGIGA